MTDTLRTDHFLKLARRMEDHTGILLPPSKRIMLEGRLRKRVRVLEMKSLEAYGTALFESGLLETEFVHLVDCVTTNKTDFFREPDHFEFLRDQIVPDLLANRDGRQQPLKIWSAASSNGAEAYTIGMVLAAMRETAKPFQFSILGTDINTSVLEQARRAVYPAGMASPIPAAIRRLYLMEATDSRRDEVRIVPELRRLTRFEHLNLTDESFGFDRDIDVIFCRNILIYFSKPMQQAVLKRLSLHLRVGGYLILGHSESFALDDKSRMAQITPTVFRRENTTATRKAA